MLGAAVTTGTQRSPRAGRPTWGRRGMVLSAPVADVRVMVVRGSWKIGRSFCSPLRSPDGLLVEAQMLRPLRICPSARVLRHLQPLSSSRAGAAFAGIRCRHGRPGAADDAPLSSGTGSLPQQWDGPDEPRARNLSRNGDINTSQDRTQRRNRIRREPRCTRLQCRSRPGLSRDWLQPREVASDAELKLGARLMALMM